LDDPSLAEKVEVIPCCVDLERFARVSGAGEDEPWELVYLGSLSGWYKFREMVAFYKVARESWGAGRMAFLTNGPPEEIRRWVAEEDLPEDEVVVESLPFADVPRRLARARVGIVFTEPGRRLESLPVKVGECLAAGLPLVVNAGMGDTEHLVRSHRVGVVVESFAEEGYRQAASELKALFGSDGSLARRCREVARTGLSLETGAEKYWAIYQSIGDGAEERQLFPATPGQA
jgi:glycosyltransferase involved in cell wall biosynthesis